MSRPGKISLDVTLVLNRVLIAIDSLQAVKKDCISFIPLVVGVHAPIVS